MNQANYLLKNVRILDPSSPHHQEVLDVLLKEGKIATLGSNLQAEGAQLKEGKNLHLSPGWVELRANFNDPGNEDRETLQSGAAAAQWGGFTAVALSPQTDPVVDTKSAVEYLRSHSRNSPVEFLPIAAFSKGLKGEELSEMYDMREAGALAFSHGTKAVSNAALMRLALLYHRELPRALQVLSYDTAMTAGGQMHEGSKSTWLGLKGIPELAESLTMARDISLAEYTGSAIHFQGVSSKMGVDLIRQAQAKGLKVSGDVNLFNLVWTDEALDQYDSNLKLYPPLRSEEDRQALITALKDGTLKGIASDHRPRTIEEKRCEFDLAQFGAASLEASFALLNTELGTELGLEKIVRCLSRENREVINYQSDSSIAEGSAMDLTLFDPEMEWNWKDHRKRSKAANYPFADYTFKGKALATYQKGQWHSISE